MKYLTLILLLILSIKSIAQKPSKKFLQEISADKSQFKQFDLAQTHFDEGNFADALEEFLNLQSGFPNNPYYDYMVAVGFILVGENYAEAAELLEKTKLAEPTLEDLNYYLGKAYQLNSEYDKAILSFTSFINEGVKKDKEIKAQKAIEECQNAANSNQPATDVRIENLGAPVNSSYNEYVPLISSDESVLIFTYRGDRSKGGKQNEFHEPDPYGHYYEDVFISYKLGDNWLEPEGISESVNSLGHDACVGLSADGQHLFLYKSSSKDGGDLYESTFDGNDWSAPKNLGPVINSKYWEGSASLSADGQTLYFSSDRPGGFGGKDIYKAHRLPDGNWNKPFNLGATVNTKYDEDSPFIHPDGVSFYFSSKGHNTIGGYDIFKAILSSNNFSQPENIGRPINTTGNDIFYVVNASGLIGYYSSGKSGGMGLQDIYRVSPGITGKLPVLCLFKGTTLFDGQPLAVTIKVTDVTNNINKGTYKTNNITAKYMIALPKGSEYKVEISSEKTKTVSQTIDLKNLEQFVDVTLDLDIDKLIKQSEAGGGQQYMQSMIEERLKEMKDEEAFQKARKAANTNTLANEEQEKQLKFMSSPMYAEMLKTYGEKQSSNINFRIELIGLNDTNSTQYNSIKKLANVELVNHPDGTKHLVVGDFKTVKEANDFRNDMISKNPEMQQSFVTGFENSQPLTVKQHFATQMKMGAGIIEKQETAVVSAPSENKTDPKQTEPVKQEMAKTEVKQEAIKNEESTSKPLNDAKQIEVVEVKQEESKKVVANSNDSLFDQRQQTQLNYMSSTSYEQILEKYKSHTKDGVKFSVEVVSDQSTDSKTYLALNKITDIKELKDANGKIHHTTIEFNTLEEADNYRKKLIVTNPEIGNSFIAVNDNNNLRTVKDYFKETMLTQMGIPPRPEETNNKIGIISNVASVPNNNNVAVNNTPKEEIKPIVNEAPKEQVAKVNPTIVAPVTNSNDSDLLVKQTEEQFTFIKSPDFDKMVAEKGNYSEEGAKFYVVPVGSKKSKSSIEFYRLAEVEIIGYRGTSAVEGAGNYSTLTEANNYRNQLKNSSNSLDSTIIVARVNDKIMPLNEYFKQVDEKLVAQNKNKETKKDEVKQEVVYVGEEEKKLATANTVGKDSLVQNTNTEILKSEKTADPLTVNNQTGNDKDLAVKENSSANKTEVIIIDKVEEPLKSENQKINNEPIVKEENNKSENIVSKVIAPIEEETETSSKKKSDSMDPSNLAYFIDKDLNNPKYYNLLIANFGKNNPNGIIFKVQIGAYRFPENFKYDGVKPLGDVAITPYPDGITRFTQREHNTLVEAEEFRQVLIKSGIKDAWVTAFVNGKRMLLQDLIKQGLLTANGL